MSTVRWPRSWSFGATLGCALFAGCNLFEAPEPTPIHLDICGSSTLGSRLVPRLVSRWLGKPYGFSDTKALEKGKPWCARGTPEEGVLTEVCVTYESSGKGLSGVTDGSCDIGMYSAPWEPVREANPNIESHPVGSDAIMIVTGSSNSTLDTAVALPTLTDWYNGENVPDGVRVLRRAESGSGTSAVFRDLIGVEELKTDDVVAADSFTEVAKGEDGSYVYYVSAQEQLAEGGFRFLEVRAADGEAAYEPSVYNIDHGYPLVHPLNLLTQQGLTGPGADFVAWAKSPAARPVFEPLFMAHVTSAEVEAAPVTGSCPSATPTEDIEGTRLGTVYFGPGEGASLRDDWQLGPIVRASIAAAQRMGKDLTVIGYTSSGGDAALEAQCQVANERADLVHLVLAGELRYMPAEASPPALRPAIVAGPTEFWGPEPADNNTAIIVAVDRAPEPVAAE